LLCSVWKPARDRGANVAAAPSSLSSVRRLAPPPPLMLPVIDDPV